MVTRGMAILLVIIGHLIQFNGFSYNNPTFEFIYSFHMPLFFSISGYIAEKVTNIKNIKQYLLYIKKKTISLIVPYVFWTIIINPLFLSEKFEYNIQNINFSLYWFLKVLFIVSCIYGIFNYINSRLIINNFYKISFSSISIILITIFIIYIGLSEVNIIMYSYSFYLGVIISKYKIVEKLCLSSICYFVATCIFMITSTKWNFNGNITDDVIKIITSTFAFIFFLNLFIKIRIYESIQNILILYGKYSLAIYMIQFYLCSFTNVDIITNGYVNPIVLFIICLLLSIPISYISIIIAKILETNKISRFLMLGKS